MTNNRLIEMLNTINEMIARSEERQRILKEMIAETDSNIKTLEDKLTALEKQTERSIFYAEETNIRSFRPGADQSGLR